MTLDAAARYRQYKAPSQPGQCFIDPALPELQSLAASRWVPQMTTDIEFCGVSWENLRGQARHEAVQFAIAYTGEYAGHKRFSGNSPGSRFDEQTAILLSGHQPEFFHSGVWFKNFLLSDLAARAGAVAINFLVDNDLCREAAISVPGRESDGELSSRKVSFDSQRTAVPWELRSLISEDCWKSFPDRVSQRLGTICSHEPLLRRLWPLATQSLGRQGAVGQALAEGRHLLELEQGLRTLELPLSHLAQTESFARFSLQLIFELPRFHEIYNSQRIAFRQAHKIRNAAHPVPALEQEHGWIEGPWWVYRASSPIRRRLWMRMIDDQLILSDRAGWQEVIEGGLDGDFAPGQWLDLQLDHVHIRPRALLTTIYTRLMIGDLFLHGIGGGKYDQLTDGIIHDFFGIEPPPFAVASATFQVPNSASKGQDSAELESAIRQLKEQSWRYRHHPREFDDELGEEGRQLAKEKELLLANIPPRGQKWDWHQQMRRVNARLKELTEGMVQANQHELSRMQLALRQVQMLESREFSFCLFPLDPTVSALRQLSQTT